MARGPAITVANAMLNYGSDFAETIEAFLEKIEELKEMDKELTKEDVKELSTKLNTELDKQIKKDVKELVTKLKDVKTGSDKNGPELIQILLKQWIDKFNLNKEAHG